MPLQITAVPHNPALLDLPWDTPLEDWPAEQLVALPRGISRHVVRFVRLDGIVYAIKEVGERLAVHEYRMLRDLERLDVPAVEAVGVVTGRKDIRGEPLEPALITRHLQFSLPYRALFSRTLRPDTATRLLDALAVLLVRLHLAGFFWGDCSLNNALFRRDAGAFAAYLVDAETGEIHSRLSDGQRNHDLAVAEENMFGGLLDLEAGGYLHPSTDAARTAADIVRRYQALWSELTRPEIVRVDERHRIDARLRRLNDLGFDVAELQMVPEDGGSTVGSRVTVQPKVVDAGHHSRRLLRLTGVDAEENQARRLLNDLDTYRASLGDRAGRDDEEIIAHRWLAEVFEPTLSSVPDDLSAKLDPAQVFHEVLEHRWFLSEAAGYDVGLPAALRSYVDTVLSFKPDEQAVLGARVGIDTPTAGDVIEDDTRSN
jgi:tRNA A-37 threonylcarbamoyl transferase component Bud32